MQEADSIHDIDGDLESASYKHICQWFSCYIIVLNFGKQICIVYFNMSKIHTLTMKL